MEWGPLTLRYTGDLTLGTGQPGVQSEGAIPVAEFAATGDFVVAPRGPLALREHQVFTHQLSLILTLRGK